ncbi:hypothetical protein E4T56_gene7279, partial [Termitomyces sp. T112]
MFLFKRRCTVALPPENPSDTILGGDDEKRSAAEVGPEENTQILLSLLPTQLDTPQLQQSDRHLASPRIFSNGILSNVNPPDGNDASITSSQSEQRSLEEDLCFGNNFLGIPASPLPSSLPVGSAGGPGASHYIDCSRGISDRIYPLLPFKVPRYKRSRFVENTQDKLSMGELPPGWKQLTHPEGQPYFYHSGKRIITECWLWDPQMFKNLNCFIDRFEEFTQERNLTQRGDVDLLLEVNRNLTKRGDVGLLLEVNVEDEISWCGYYYVWASTRTVFWLEHFDLSSHVPELKGHVSSTYTKAYLEYQYWYHWNLFPNIHDVDDDIYDLVANTIADARTDVHTSRSSTVTLTKEQLKEMAEIVEGMKTKARYQNYYGQYGARLDYEQSVYSNKPPEETLLFKIFSPLLFFAPNVSLKSLNEVWVDGITIRARCLDFFFQMNIQWRGHIVHASILLNANVAFLAIPSNDPSNNTLTLQSNRTGAQIISYLSIVTSLASMLLASMLVRKHSSKQYDSLYDYTFSKYLDTHHHPKYG